MEIKVKGKNYLFQWDCGQVLTITGSPARYVDFSAPEDPDGVIRIEVQDGECPIPDKWLQTAGNRTIWVCLADDTRVVVNIRIKSRPKPPDYVYTPDERVTFDALVQKILEMTDNLPSDPAEIQRIVDEYLAANPPKVTASFETDNTLILEDGILRVNTTDIAEKDNTQPITSAGVDTVVGNIGAILDTI